MRLYQNDLKIYKHHNLLASSMPEQNSHVANSWHYGFTTIKTTRSRLTRAIANNARKPGNISKSCNQNWPLNLTYNQYTNKKLTKYLTNQQSEHKDTRNPIDSHKHILQLISWSRVVTNRGRCLCRQIEATNVPEKTPKYIFSDRQTFVSV